MIPPFVATRLRAATVLLARPGGLAADAGDRRAALGQGRLLLSLAPLTDKPLRGIVGALARVRHEGDRLRVHVKSPIDAPILMLARV